MNGGIEVKLFEVRDEGTQIPCMVTALWGGELKNEESYVEAWLVNRAGWGDSSIALYFHEMCVEPYTGSWAKASAYQAVLHTTDVMFDSSRTLRIAWTWVMQHWDELSSGDVVDVQFILGETKRPKDSGYDERW